MNSEINEDNYLQKAIDGEILDEVIIDNDNEEHEHCDDHSDDDHNHDNDDNDGFYDMKEIKDTSESSIKKLVLVCIVCFAFMVAEIVGGIISDSIAILTDAAHLLSDLSGFLISIISLYIGRRPASRLLSYGYHRAEVIGALISVAIIWFLTIELVYLAIQRVFVPEEVNGEVMFYTSCFGILSNCVMAKMLHGHGGHSHGHSHNHEEEEEANEDGKERHNHQSIFRHSHGHKHSHGHCHRHDDRHKHSEHHDCTKKHRNQKKASSMAKPLLIEIPNKTNLTTDGGDDDSENKKINQFKMETDSSIDNKDVNSAHGIKTESQINNRSNPDKISPNYIQNRNNNIVEIDQEKHLNDHKYDCETENHRMASKKSIKQNLSMIHDHQNPNVRAAFIHIIGDFIQSIGVMIAAIVIWFFPEMDIVDPICTFFFSIIVLFTTINIARECLHILMEGTPSQFDLTEFEQGLLNLEGVVEVHDLHIWSLSVGKPAMSAHIISEKPLRTLQKANKYCKKYGIYHSTLQIEQTKVKKSSFFVNCEQNLHSERVIDKKE